MDQDSAQPSSLQQQDPAAQPAVPVPEPVAPAESVPQPPQPVQQPEQPSLPSETQPTEPGQPPVTAQEPVVPTPEPTSATPQASDPELISVQQPAAQEASGTTNTASPVVSLATEKMQSTATAVPPTPASEHHSSGFFEKVFPLLLGFIILAGVGYAGYIMGENQFLQKSSHNNSAKSAAGDIKMTGTMQKVSPTLTSDITANWKTYHDSQNYYSFQYPTSWALKNGLSFKTDTAIYDPTTTKNWSTNGNGTVSWPVHYVDILSVETTSTTAAQLVADYENSWKVTDTQLHRVSVNRDGMDFEFYDLEGGNTVRYRNVAISNGKFLLKAESSINQLGDGSIESQILSSFKFTQ